MIIENVKTETDQAAQDMQRLRHMLGATADIPRDRRGYRNRYCAAAGPQTESMERLVALGYVEFIRETNSPSGPMRHYQATRAGCVQAGLKRKQIERALAD